MRTVRIKECTGDIDDLLASPYEYESRIFGYDCNLSCLEVLFLGICEELVNILWSNNNCHTLLGLGDGDLCSVKSCIFLRYFIKFNSESVCKLSDCYGYAAGTKVVTFLNNMADFFSAEKSLQLTLGRCVTFLHLCATYGCGLCVVCLGRSGCTTDSVTSGTSAEEDDLVSWVRSQSLYGTSRCCTHDGTDFHTLCNVIRMVNLLNITG